MKKLIVCLLLLCLTVSTCALCEGLSIADVAADGEYTVKLEQKIHLYPFGEGKRYYHVAQGCATDGEYGYFITISKLHGKGAVWKVRLSDWSETAMVYGLPLDHGNDAAYNSKKHQLIVVNNAPNYGTLTVLDPDTLEVIRQLQPGFEAYAIAYNAARDQYLIGISGSFDTLITDSDFNVIRRIPGIDTGIVKQGMDCDDRYIYFPQWDSQNHRNYIIVYDWEGNYVNYLSVDSSNEIESMFHVGEEIYLAFAGNGCKVYHGTVHKK